jgi:hypothetical protein
MTQMALTHEQGLVADKGSPAVAPTFPPVIRIASSLVFLAAHRIKVKRALFNQIATPGDGARDGRLPLRIDQTNVPLAGSNESGSARAVLHLCRGRSTSHRLQRQPGNQSLWTVGPLRE